MTSLRKTYKLPLLLALVATSLFVAGSARANVYATNIKLNGALNNATLSGSAVSISYILNEPASAGVTVTILSGSTAVRTINIAGGSAGALKGVNTVNWDGKNDANAGVPAGNYSVSITAASTGYGTWTQITTDTDPGITDNNNATFWPSGIAVDYNTNSPYYGRVFVCNSPSSGSAGILKLNADGSFSDEPQSNAGYTFAPDGYLGDACRCLKIGQDDRVYFNDWTGNGKVVACDMLLSSNQVVCDSATFSDTITGNFGDIDVSGLGTTNALVWMTDSPSAPSVGVWAFPLDTNGVFDFNTATAINVAASGGGNMPLRAGYGLAVDENGGIWIGQTRSGTGQSSPRLCYITNWSTAPSLPIYDGQTNWDIGAFDDTMRGVSAVAIDNRYNPKYVGVAMSGGIGGLQIINVTNGTLATAIQQDGTAFYVSVAFDNVGNVYGGLGAHLWRAFSPPGANQATTKSVFNIQVVPGFKITGISVSGGLVTINFTANGNDSTAFKLVSSATANGTYADTGAVATGTAGSFSFTTAASGASRFYQISR